MMRSDRWRLHPRGRVRGFTLIEVMVALSLGTVILLGARLAADQLAAASSGIDEHASSLNYEINAERFLRLLVANAEVGTADSTWFVGAPNSATFTSWCPVPGGWEEKCTVAFGLHRVNDSLIVTASLSTGSAIRLRHRGQPAALRYLSDARDGGHWLVTVGRTLVPPLGLAVIFAVDATHADTLFLRLGERG